MRGLLRVPESHRSILVADQDLRVRELLIRSLERDGFSIYEAAAGREVIEHAKKRIVDILIMEMDLPDLDGVHTLRMVNQLVGPIPCIFIGAELSKEMWLNAMMENAFALLQMPFSGEVVRRTVWELIHRHFERPL
jgi:DNA-binding NtrC family response regulator